MRGCGARKSGHTLLAKLLSSHSYHFLLQGIFPIQGSNPCFLHWQVNSLPLRHLESPSVVGLQTYASWNPQGIIVRIYSFIWPKWGLVHLKANSWNEGCIGMQRKASVRSSTVSYLSFPGIWTNIRIGHQGMCKDHCIIYCSKVLYRLILPICLNNWQNRVLNSDWQGTEAMF